MRLFSEFSGLSVLDLEHLTGTNWCEILSQKEPCGRGGADLAGEYVTLVPIRVEIAGAAEQRVCAGIWDSAGSKVATQTAAPTRLGNCYMVFHTGELGNGIYHLRLWEDCGHSLYRQLKILSRNTPEVQASVQLDGAYAVEGRRTFAP